MRLKRSILTPWSHQQGFSLIELLVVIGIIGLMATLSVPAYRVITKSTGLVASASALTSHLNLARQTALTQNRPVEFRLYEVPLDSGNEKSEKVFRCFRLLLNKGTTDGTTNYVDLVKVQYLDTGIVIHSDATYSSLLSGASGFPPRESGTLPGNSTPRGYFAFEFRPNGSTDLASSEQHFITLYSKNGSQTPGLVPGLPANFVTIDINPVTGKSKIFRP